MLSQTQMGVDVEASRTKCAATGSARNDCAAIEIVDPPDWLVEKYGGPAPRYTSYPPATAWTEAVGPASHQRQLVEAASRPGPLSVYVHIPFCRALCSYCGCNVVAGSNRRAADAYLDVVAAEMTLAAGLLGERRRVSQLHWGGGTPNFLNENQLTRLAAAFGSHFRLEPDAEAAIEVNPATCTVGQLERLRSLGFNRISFGVQDLDPDVQRAVRRAPVGARLAGLFAAARQLGFRGINFDLIYGLPQQTQERWGRTLDRVLELNPDRLAIYGFAFIPEILLHQRVLDAQTVPKGRDKLALFRHAYSRLLQAGYRHIGMDHFAKADDELALAQERRTLRRNFQGYTANLATDVVAFGASAISDIGGTYTQNARELETYAASIQKGRFATVRGLQPSENDSRRREFIQQLMCNFRVTLPPAPELRAERESLEPLERDGLVRIDGDEVQVTPLGRFFIRNIANVFDTYPASSAMARAV